jgi:undecaprenyl diphosphate synthase
VRRMLADAVRPEAVSEELLATYLDTAGVVDPDLIIRTAGEMRMSNFLLWQAAYAEYWWTPTRWPDFGKDEFYRALCAYGQRQRRFGGVPDAPSPVAD